MIAATLILAATLTALPPVSVPETTFIRGEVRIDVVRDSGGKIVKAVVTRVDGKPMTSCAAYTALVEQEYACQSGWCGTYTNLATGSGYGESEQDACDAAKAEMCAARGCGVGTPTYCSTTANQVFALVGESGGSCMYSAAGWCFISWDC